MPEAGFGSKSVRAGEMTDTLSSGLKHSLPHDTFVLASVLTNIKGSSDPQAGLRLFRWEW